MNITKIKQDYRERIKKWGRQSKRKYTPSEICCAIGVVNNYGTSELKTLFNDSGLGNHPEVIGIFVKIGKKIKRLERIIKHAR